MKVFYRFLLVLLLIFLPTLWYEASAFKFYTDRTDKCVERIQGSHDLWT